jgi:ABC-type spermidine/putrescine transport system permease subunit II
MVAWLGALFGTLTAITAAVGGNIFLKQTTNFLKYREEHNMGLQGVAAPLLAGSFAVGIPLITMMIANRSRSANQEYADAANITINVEHDDDPATYGGF